jgi:hypothetical protein
LAEVLSEKQFKKHVNDVILKDAVAKRLSDGRVTIIPPNLPEDMAIVSMKISRDGTRVERLALRGRGIRSKHWIARFTADWQWVDVNLPIETERII